MVHRAHVQVTERMRALMTEGRLREMVAEGLVADER